MTSGRTSPDNPTNVSVGTLVLSLLAGVVRAGALFAAYIASGSSALLTASVHALVEASSQMFMLSGEARLRSRSELWKDPGATDELAFWGPVAATLLYAVGAGVAIFEGARTLVVLRVLDKSDAALLALAAAILTTVVLLWQLRMLVRRRPPADEVGRVLQRGLGPVVVHTLGLELRSAIAGLSVAALGIVAASRLGVVAADGGASIAIGLIMALTAASFAIEVKRLLSRDRAVPALSSTSIGGGLDATAKAPEAKATGMVAPTRAETSDVRANHSVAVVAERQSNASPIHAEQGAPSMSAEKTMADGFPDDDPSTGGSPASRKARKKARRRHP